jgi:hypothetical protein
MHHVIVVISRPLSQPRRQPIFGQISVSQPPNSLTAESATDLKKSGPSAKLKIPEKKIVIRHFGPLSTIKLR